MGRPCGCCADYTTRSYDFDGNILWSANYFDGYDPSHTSAWETTYSWGNYVTCQAINSSVVYPSQQNVYVGGSRISADGSTYWDIRAFSLVDGSLQWQRDLLNDVTSAGQTYNNGIVQQIVIDKDGNIHCLLQATINPFAGSGAGTWGSLQAIVVLSPSNSLIAVRTFPTDAWFAGFTANVTSFVVNEDGDYHFVNGTGNVYEFVAPFTSPPASYAGVGGRIIRRFDGRDYFGASGELPLSTMIAFPTIIIRGIKQKRVPRDASEIDLRITYAPGVDPPPDQWGYCAGALSDVYDIAVDSEGSIVAAGLMNTSEEPYSGSGPIVCGTTWNTVRKWDINGILQWSDFCDGRSLAVDNSNAVYVSGSTVGHVNFDKRSSAGSYQWGHFHARGDNFGIGAWVSLREVDVNGGTSVIRTGGNNTILGTIGPAKRATDQNYLPIPCQSIVVDPQYPYGSGPCTGSCFYVAINIGPPGGVEFLVWEEVFSGTGGGMFSGVLYPTCSTGCACKPFVSPTSIPFDNGPYFDFCNEFGYPTTYGEVLETVCV